jgi:hypothetical protein
MNADICRRTHIVRLGDEHCPPTGEDPSESTFFASLHSHLKILWRVLTDQEAEREAVEDLYSNMAMVSPVGECAESKISGAHRGRKVGRGSRTARKAPTSFCHSLDLSTTNIHVVGLHGLGMDLEKYPWRRGDTCTCTPVTAAARRQLRGQPPSSSQRSAAEIAAEFRKRMSEGGDPFSPAPARGAVPLGDISLQVDADETIVRSPSVEPPAVPTLDVVVMRTRTPGYVPLSTQEGDNRVGIGIKFYPNKIGDHVVTYILPGGPADATGKREGHRIPPSSSLLLQPAPNARENRLQSFLAIDREMIETIAKLCKIRSRSPTRAKQRGPC